MLHTKQPPKVSDLITIFVALAVVFATLTIVAQLLFANNSFIYTILVSLGSAVFGAGLAFFLIEMAEIQPKTRFTSRTALFLGMALVFLLLVLVAQNFLLANPLAHTIFVSVGAATFGGGLTYFLVDTFAGKA